MAEFEKNVKDLESVIEKLSAGDLSLKESMALYEKGIKLARTMEKQLDETEKKVNIILEGKEEAFDNSVQQAKVMQMEIGEKNE